MVNVRVPSDTPSGDTVYLSGNYDVLGTGIPSSDDWAADDYPMTQTGTDTWSITITGVPAAAFQYKFTLGSWSNVEETAQLRRRRQPGLRLRHRRRHLPSQRHRRRVGSPRFLLTTSAPAVARPGPEGRPAPRRRARPRWPGAGPGPGGPARSR